MVARADEAQREAIFDRSNRLSSGFFVCGWKSELSWVSLLKYGESRLAYLSKIDWWRSNIAVVTRGMQNLEISSDATDSV